uniref:C-type lectin domain-containing protein n=1 Tax=Panagrolaimus sp. ES5 TaxID=591445 RepID=A0AC34F2R3_9BILA
MQIFNISNKGEHTSRAAVITFATNVTIKFNLNDSNTGSDTWLNHILIMLPHYHKSNDSGANANDALKVAQNMLTYSQPSFRVPTIFLIAAGYNSTGYLPNFGDTRILSLSYAPENTNCFCPKNSYQLQNTVANVQTLYADCYFGSTKAALPSFELCNPGTLAIINSEKKFDDVFYAILSDFKYIKNFTIGFHKSLDGQWKWWDYDGSEFSVGDYPAFYKTPNPDDNFGYMSRYYGYNWRLETGRNVALPYLCQMRACDASNICNQTILT